MRHLLMAPSVLEGEVALVVEVELEHAAFVFQGADRNGRDEYIDRAEPIIGFLCLLEPIALVLGNGSLDSRLTHFSTRIASPIRILVRITPPQHLSSRLVQSCKQPYRVDFQCLSLIS